VTLSQCGGQPSRVVTQRIVTTDAHPAAGAAELAAESDVVVRGVVTGRRRYEEVSGVPFVVSEVRVTSVLAGPATGAVWVRQVGGPGVETSAVPVLAPDRVYVLFLQRFAYRAGAPSDQFVVTGNGAGIVAV
jgi:hypothetical protein